MPWKVVAASVRGSAHEESGEPCQDASAHVVVGEWLVAAVCDGAGSARLSSLGASVGCRAAVDALAALLEATFPRGDGELASLCRDAVRAARAEVRVRAAAQGAELADGHATMVGVVAGVSRGIFFHVGDGAAVALPADPSSRAVVSRPENGDFAEQTYFFTEDGWEERLRFLSFSGAGRIVLMSDGAMSFAMAPGLAGPDPAFFDPVSRHLAKVDVDAGSRALQATLDHSRTREITRDDKTLLWAMRHA